MYGLNVTFLELYVEFLCQVTNASPGVHLAL